MFFFFFVCLFSFSQKKRPSEPIYAEPSKPGAVFKAPPPTARVSSCSTDASQSDEYDGVQLRHGPKTSESDTAVSDTESVTYENTSVLSTETNGKLRHSDSLVNEYSNTNRDDAVVVVVQRTVNNAQRKFHSKSFSLSENRVAANLNLFQQNRELWEKRTETTQSTHSLTAPRILSRNRIAPDLVMDLPVSNKDRTVNSSHESLNSSDEANSDGAIANGSTDKKGNDVVNSKSTEDMTSAERFATQSQCTLKKNERFSAGTSTNSETNDLHKENQVDIKASTSNPPLSNRTTTHEKPKAEIKPQESTLLKDFSRSNEINNESSIPVITKDQASIKPITAAKDIQHKSPIPNRNTQKFVSQFADLKLTGGCLSSGSNTTPINTITDASNTQQQATPLSSFKPQVKVKPQILRKPLVLPPTTPESVRRNQE